MKFIDNDLRHLSEKKALRVMAAREDAKLADTVGKIQRKKDEDTARFREEFVKEDRRRFLNLVAKSGISAGLIRASSLIGGIVASRHAMAQDNSNKRVIFVYTDNGGKGGVWLPKSQTEMNWTSHHYGDIASFCHFREVNMAADNSHGSSLQSMGVYYSTGDKKTMDARIADVIGTTSPKKFLFFGSYATDRSQQRCSTIGQIQDNVGQQFDDTFNGFTANPASTDTTYQLSYDSQMYALEQIKSKLSAEEYQRYQEHAAAITKAKTQFAEKAKYGSCEKGTRPAGGNILQAAQQSADIIVKAFACGISKVATLQIGNEQGMWEDHHGAAHSGNFNRYTDLNKWIYQAPAHLIRQLANTIGPDGKPLIETTVVVQITDMGDGEAHGINNCPFLVATKMPGFKQGYSASGGGMVEDLIGTIPKGMGLTGINFGGSNTVGLI